MVGPQANTMAFTSLFTFASSLRPMLSPADLDFVDSQLNRENVDTPTTIDQWADSQTTVPTNAQFPDGRDVIPYYTVLPTNGTIVNVCMNNDYFTAGDDENKFGMFRHFRITTTGSSTYTITATANPPLTTTSLPGDAPPRDDSDPDLFLHRAGQWFEFANSTEDGGGEEIFNTPTIGAGTYILRLQEWRHFDDAAAGTFPTQVCFDVSMTP